MAEEETGYGYMGQKKRLRESGGFRLLTKSVLDGNRGFDGRVRVITFQLEVFKLVIK